MLVISASKMASIPEGKKIRRVASKAARCKDGYVAGINLLRWAVFAYPRFLPS
jgi:hypothetical protein